LLRTILSLVTSLTLATALLACSDEPSGDADVAVSASTTQLGDIARNVAGERATVTGILSPGSDPHDYEPAPSDVEAVVDADLVLRSGGDLDLWLDDLLESSGSDAPVLTALDRAPAVAEDDPHWWQDPTNAIAVAGAVRDELIAVDPGGESRYRESAAEYIAALEVLDREIAACIDRVPPEDRKLVTSHDSLGPFADRYGIEFVGAAIPALTTQAQPSAGETAELVELIESEDVRAVFPEAGVSASLEEAIADETGAAIGGELWADALGPEGSSGATYVEAMRSNATEIASGMSGGEVSCSG
jgi:ABC-type Zn uptake system ZnuABC Zn-binding protein ZnuA